jgi:hypothetical protein
MFVGVNFVVLSNPTEHVDSEVEVLCFLALPLVGLAQRWTMNVLQQMLTSII